MTLRLKILCFLSVFFLFCLQAETAQKTGLELSDSVFSLLKNNAFEPETQSLITSGENSFPYNVIVNLNKPDIEKENLILVFFQEDIEDNSKIILQFLRDIKKRQYDFNITLLFTYGDRPVFNNKYNIYGTRIFADSLKSNLQYTSIIFDFSGKIYNIISSSCKTSSPSWLIRNSYNIYSELDIDDNLSRFYLSQISTYSFIHNRILSDFFEYEIPAIKLDIKAADEGDEKKLLILTKAVQAFSLERNRNWEHHFLMFKLFGRYSTLSEATIIRTILPVICCWVLFIFIFIFINTRLKKRAWSTIKRIWYSVPTVFLISFASVAISRIIFSNILTYSSDAAKIYGLFSLQIIITLLFSIIFFLLTLYYNNYFEAHSIDYLLLISCFINQSVFILLDISLSPVFTLICLFTLISLIIKNNTLHVIVFILMILPLIPYANNVISCSDLNLLKNFVFESKKIIFILPLILYPDYLIILRILTSIRKKSGTFSIVVAAGVIFFLSVSIFLISLSLVRVKQLNRIQKKSPEISYMDNAEKFISFESHDELIFDDIIRSINIKLNEKCVFCSVQISGQKNPVLYTDNDLTIISTNTVRFNIPEYPPENLTFSYGTMNEASTVLITAIINQNGRYFYISRAVELGVF